MSFANKVKAKKALAEAKEEEALREKAIEESKGHNGPQGPTPEHVFSSPLELCCEPTVEEDEDGTVKVEPVVYKKLTLKQAMKRIEKMEETMRLIKDLLYNC